MKKSIFAYFQALLGALILNHDSDASHQSCLFLSFSKNGSCNRKLQKGCLLKEFYQSFTVLGLQFVCQLIINYTLFVLYRTHRVSN